MIPQITMNLRDIPLIDAIRYVTEIAGLKFRIESNAVIITPLSDIVTAMVTRIYPVQPTLFRTYFADATTDQQTQQDRTGSGGGEYIGMRSSRQMVNVAQYSQLVRLMFQEMGVAFPVGSSISYNERISTLIVKNTPENLELLERVLLVLNVIPHQVEIEAKFVEISQDDLEQMAIQWFLTDNYEIVSQRGAGPLSGRQRLQINQDEIDLRPALRHGRGTAVRHQRIVHDRRCGRRLLPGRHAAVVVDGPDDFEEHLDRKPTAMAGRIHERYDFDTKPGNLGSQL